MLKLRAERRTSSCKAGALPAGKKVGARTTTDLTTVHFGDTNAAGVYVSDDAAKQSTLWTYHSFCSAHLEEKEQWGAGMGLVDDVFLTVEEWTNLNDTLAESAGFVGLSAHAVDIATKTAYAVGAFGMGGYEKIVEINCGVAAYVCFAISGYNGNFGANTALAARKNTISGNRVDGTPWAYAQNIVPTRVYVGVKGYTQAGVACAGACTWLQKNGLEHGKVYGFAAPIATADRDAWHKGNFRQAWEFQEAPVIAGAAATAGWAAATLNL